MTKRLYFLIIVLTIVLNCHSQVTHVETYYNNQGGIEGLIEPNNIEIDTSGNIYFVGNSTLTHFITDKSLKAFSYVESYNSAIYQGLWNVDEIQSTLNKKFYYLTGDNELFVFNKIANTGKLILAQSIKDSDTLTIGYGVTNHIAISPDSKSFYLSSQYAFDDAIMIFTIDSISGILTYQSELTNIKAINSIVCNNSYTYTASAGSKETSLSVLKRSEDLKGLELIQKLTTSDSIISPSSLLISKDNRFLYAYDEKTIAIFSINQTSGMLTFVERLKIDDCFEGFWFARSFIISEDNHQLYLGGEYSLSVYSRDTLTGKLSFVQVIMEGENNFEGFNTVSSLEFFKGDTILAALSKYNNSILLFKRNKENGLLSYEKTISNGDGKIKGLMSVTDVLVSKNDKQLYTLSGGLNSIGIFNRLTDGHLINSGNINWNELGPAIGDPINFESNPNDSYIYISSSTMYGIREMKRNPEKGDLQYYKSYTNTGSITDEVITDFVITDDAKNLYAVTSSNIILYRINPDSSDLTYLSKINIDDQGNGGLIGTKNIVLSHDGKNVYTHAQSAFNPNGISLYTRNATNGSLTFVENYTSADYPFWIEKPFSLAISPDDSFLYAAGTSILIFKREINGKLDFIKEIKYTDIGLDFVYSLDQILISADGKSLIGITRMSKSLLSFYRFLSDGDLTLKQVNRYSDNMIYSGTFPKEVISVDTKNLYIISQVDGSISVFKTCVPLGLKKHYNGCMGDTLKITIDDGHHYDWSTGDTTNSIKCALPGQYTVYVRDSIGREGYDTTNIVFHPLPTVMLAIDTTLSTSDTTYINTKINGGLYPYRYFWNDSLSARNRMIVTAEKPTGNYLFSLTVTDDYGCKGSDSILISIDNDRPGVIENSKLGNISFYPSPVSDFLTIIGENTINFIEITDIQGNLIKKINVDNNSAKINLSNLFPGIYILKISGCDYYFSKIIVKNK